MILDSLGGPHVTTEVLLTERQRAGGDVMTEAEVGLVPQSPPRNVDSREAGKGKEVDSSSEPPEGTPPG